MPAPPPETADPVRPRAGARAVRTAPFALRAAALGSALAAALLVATGAGAQAGTTEQEKPREVTVDATPMFGSSAPVPWGWSGGVVRLHNAGSAPRRGRLVAEARQYGQKSPFQVSAPWSAPPGGSVHVRIPMFAPSYADLELTAYDDAGSPIASASFSTTAQGSVVLLDVSEASPVRAAVNEALVSPQFDPTGGVRSHGSGPALTVTSPRFDPATGDPILPDRAALYSGASAVLLRTDTLARLGAAELDALAGWVLAGGTLALTVTRPEDLRHPALVALVGGEPEAMAPWAETLARLEDPGGSPSGGGSTGTTPPPSTPGGGRKRIESPRHPGDDLGKQLTGYRGGNLRGSPYGSSAAYGLGEVHLLAFDPGKPAHVDDPWVQARLVDLARRGFDRRSIVAFRPGAEREHDELVPVRKQLDPNESSRWAIGAAALLLCAYAAIAGPVNFSLAAKRGRPLRALRWLVVLSAAAFAMVVGIGVVAKGVRGRSRHLTLVEAGAGMTKGTARRFRGFFMPRGRELTIPATDAGSVVQSAAVGEPGDHRDELVVDRDGARLVGVPALPWQTVVVREDGFASLGDGITMVPDGENGLAITNRSGRALRGVILVDPNGPNRYFARIEDGEKVLAKTGQDLASIPEGRAWEIQMQRASHAGALSIRRLRGEMLRPIVDGDVAGLGEAWAAIDDAAGDAVDWFPSDVPVLLAQLEGGEGRAKDSGLAIERDRTLVRIVGWGGRP